MLLVCVVNTVTLFIIGLKSPPQDYDSAGPALGHTILLKGMADALGMSVDFK